MISGKNMQKKLNKKNYENLFSFFLLYENLLLKIQQQKNYEINKV